MKSNRLLALPNAALAFAPPTALADGGQEESRQWLDSLPGPRSVREVRAKALQRLPQLGDRRPVEVTLAPETTHSRVEVRAELAEYGRASAGA